MRKHRQRENYIYPVTQLNYESHSARVNPNSRPNLLFIITSWIWFGWAVKVFEGVGGWRGSRFYIYLFCDYLLSQMSAQQIIYNSNTCHTSYISYKQLVSTFSLSLSYPRIGSQCSPYLQLQILIQFVRKKYAQNMILYTRYMY